MPPKKVTPKTATTTKPSTKTHVAVTQASVPAVQVAVPEKVEKPGVQHLKLKEAIPNEMKKLQDLKRWPIIMDDVGNLKTFYRMNELLIDFNMPLTVERVKVPLQSAFFGLSFNPDGSINDHRQYTIPNDVHRMITLIMYDRNIGECIEELRKVCGQIHPDLFETVFIKADVKESGRDDLDRLFTLTQTPDQISKADYYQFGAKNRNEIPFLCVWMSQLTEIPAAYDHFFGPRFKIYYD